MAPLDELLLPDDLLYEELLLDKPMGSGVASIAG
jgi:hypothetical protein